jgi:hypothetical protein
MRASQRPRGLLAAHAITVAKQRRSAPGCSRRQPERRLPDRSRTSNRPDAADSAGTPAPRALLRGPRPENRFGTPASASTAWRPNTAATPMRVFHHNQRLPSRSPAEGAPGQAAWRYRRSASRISSEVVVPSDWARSSSCVVALGPAGRIRRDDDAKKDSSTCCLPTALRAARPSRRAWGTLIRTQPV